MNQGLGPRTRATALSVGVSNSVGHVAQGVAFAGVVGLAGVRVALTIGSSLTVPAAWLVRRGPPEEGAEQGTRPDSR